MPKVPLHKHEMTKTEEKLMGLFWDSEIPLTSISIMKNVGEKYWSYNSLHMMMRSLKKKGMLEECGAIKGTTRGAIAHRPKMTREEYGVRLLQNRGIDPCGIVRVTTKMVLKKSKNDIKGEYAKVLKQASTDIKKATMA